MEFGFFVQGYVPNSLREKNPDAEHHALLEDLELCQAADRAGFKYIWVSEHHFLDEYSHISANEVFLGALASTTQRAHLGSGIFNPLPKIHHPATLAERAAMLDQLTAGRFEFGTGRGSGSAEVTGFHTELADASGTREIWAETVDEFVKMWTQDVYEGFSGKYWNMPPRRILPRPYGGSHPPMWYAAGNYSSYEMAAHKGMGLLGFSLDHISRTEQAVKIYKKAIENADPVGEYVNDNVLVALLTTYVDEDRDRARRDFLGGETARYTAQAMRYHDQIPKPEGYPTWPQSPPEPDEAALEAMIDLGAAIVGDPDEVTSQLKRWEATGTDQIMLGRGSKTREQTLEMIRLVGEHVIPRFDTDPVHRTTKFRNQTR